MPAKKVSALEEAQMIIQTEIDSLNAQILAYEDKTFELQTQLNALERADTALDELK